jgi:hypothetical protein
LKESGSIWAQISYGLTAAGFLGPANPSQFSTVQHLREARLHTTVIGGFL